MDGDTFQQTNYYIMPNCLTKSCDFSILATHIKPSLRVPWLKALGNQLSTFSLIPKPPCFFFFFSSLACIRTKEQKMEEVWE